MNEFKRVALLIILGLLFAGSLGCLLTSGVLTKVLTH